MIYGNGEEITQSPGYVTITYEMIHDTRVISTDNRPHVSPKIQEYLGDSKGHWEGDELVVDTIGLNDKTFVDNYRTPHTDKMHVIERFTAAQLSFAGFDSS